MVTYCRTMDMNQVIYEMEDILNQAKIKLDIIKKAQDNSNLRNLNDLNSQLNYGLDLNLDTLTKSCDLVEKKAFEELLSNLRSFLKDEITFGRDSTVD